MQFIKPDRVMSGIVGAITALLIAHAFRHAIQLLLSAHDRWEATRNYTFDCASPDTARASTLEEMLNRIKQSASQRSTLSASSDKTGLPEGNPPSQVPA
jgi:hypothetical protein